MRTGLRGLVLLGSNGEAPFIDRDEIERVVATARDGRARRSRAARRHRQPVDAADARRVPSAARAGADAVLVLTPSVFRGAAHAGRAAAATTAPSPTSRRCRCCSTTIPPPTGVNLTPALARTLAEHPNIVGIKESSGDVAVVADLVTQTPDGFHVVVGVAPTLYPSLTCGADGGVVAVANAIPELCVRLHELVRAGRHDEALALQRAHLRRSAARSRRPTACPA